METNNQHPEPRWVQDLRANEVKDVAATASGVTVADLREREADVLYAFVLLFTFGQMFLIIWDMLSMVKGFSAIAALIGVRDVSTIHPFGEMTTMYLGLVGAYIGRNAYQRYKSDKENFSGFREQYGV